MVSAHAYQQQGGAGAAGASVKETAVRAETHVKAAVEDLQARNEGIIRSAAFVVAEVRRAGCWVAGFPAPSTLLLWWLRRSSRSFFAQHTPDGTHLLVLLPAGGGRPDSPQTCIRVPVSWAQQGLRPSR